MSDSKENFKSAVAVTFLYLVGQLIYLAYKGIKTIIDWAIVNWPVLLGISFVWFVVYIAIKQKKATKERQAEAEKRQAEADAARQRNEAARERQRQEELNRINLRKSQQLGLYTSLLNLTSDSFALFEVLPSHLMTTEELLDQADADFEEGAFAPFWDSVEQAAMQLGRFDDGVRTITTNAQRHSAVAKSYEGTPPPFPIVLDSVTGMAAAKATNDRMRAIVRKAQCSFQFATIFEQRKTNQLIVAGFTNLAQALDGMGSRIESSIDDLGGQISQMSSTIDESLQSLGSGLNQTLTTLHESTMEASERMASKVDGLHMSFQKDSGDRAKRHQKTLEMLDNIQRRRRPLPKGDRDGDF